jgi:Protein of unknown function (DUF3800)
VQIFFDESGDFNTASKSGYKFSFIVGVILPDQALPRLKVDFDWFVKQLGPEERKQGEPKGSLLSFAHRKILLQILKTHNDVMLIPISVNLGSDDPSFYENAPARIRALIESNLHAPSDVWTAEERAELAKRFARMSAPALARIVSYGIVVQKAIEAITSRYHCAQFHSDYDPVTITFDRTGRPQNREELVLDDSLFGWIANWSRTVPLRIHPSLDESHPFLAKYGKRAPDNRWTLDLSKMLKGKVSYEDSRAQWLLQLADFAANTWAQTIGDYEGNKGFQELFLDLYRKSALPDDTPVGVVAPTDKTERVSAPDYLEVFARIAYGEKKLLPCRWRTGNNE